MFTSKGLFFSVLCPYSDSCTLPRCIFLHSKSDATELNAKGSRPGPAQDIIGSNSRTPNDCGQNRKDAALPASFETKTDKTPKFKTALRTACRDVSPPPLRRAPGDVPNKTMVTQQSKVELAKPEIPIKSPPAKRQKVEVLNPRMLKSSPASHDLRYRLLKALHDQFIRLNNELKQDANNSGESLVLSDQALIVMALDLEEAAATEKPSIYSNVVKNKILAYKRMSVKDWRDERVKEFSQRDALKVINSDSATSEPSKSIETGLSPEEELSFLPRLYTPILNLSKHGYVSTIPTAEEIKQAQQGVEAANGWEVCDRCKSRFQVFPGRREEDGALTSGGPCKYHWGKAYLQDKPVTDPKARREKKYRCCGESIGDSTGCTQADLHVFKVSEVKRLAAILNFAETPENQAGSKRPVCIDGEMGYTVHGLELIRLTATLWPDGEELFDVLVRPFGEILDLNSRFSGVWPQQMTNATPWTPVQSDATLTLRNQNGEAHEGIRIVSSPLEARSLLFRHLSPNTPLIGHGLENDLNAVRIIHPTIIDTALLFPHKAGLPYRNSLKALMLTHLRRHIQVVSDDKICGHDSKEDAMAAGDLVRYMIRAEWQKMKKNGWRLESGQFLPSTSVDQFHRLPTEPKSILTVDFLEKDQASPDIFDPSKDGSGAGAAKCGSKRLLAEVSRDDFEEGEIDE